MKKALTLLLVFVMVLSLVACDNDPLTTTGSKKDPTTKPSTGTTTVPTTTPATAPSTAPTTPKEDGDIGYAETVIVDNNHCTFKVMSITVDDVYYTLKVYIENKTSVTQMFSLSGVTVNDYMVDPFWAVELGAGLNKVDEIFFLRSDLEYNGITDPTKIEFYLSVYDYDSWDAASFVGDVFTVYPLGEEAHVDDGGYTAQDGDIVLVNNENCTVIVTGFDPENMWGYTMNLYILNKTDKNLTFSMNDVTVNDLMLDPWWSMEVAAGKRSHSPVVWMGTEMTDYNIGDVTKISFALTAMDWSDWESVDLAGVSTTIYPMGEEAAASYQRPAQDTDIILLDNEYVTVTVTGIDAEGLLGYTVMLYVQSKSDIALRVDADDVSVNGFILDPYWAVELIPGKSTYSSMSWFAGDLEFNGITTVETITMTLKVYDEEAWEPFTSDTVTINP